MKEIIGTIAVILTFAGYVPYMKHTIQGKTTPHVYTWFLWSSVSFIAFALQVSDGAGPGSFVTLAAAIAAFVVFLLGLRQGKKNITVSDTIFLGLAFLSLMLWLFAKQPVISTILVSLTDILAFFPTIRKSWKKPEQETLSSYVINTFRFGLALIALDRYSIVTSLYPATWLVANGLFSVYLLIRRKQISVTRKGAAH